MGAIVKFEIVEPSEPSEPEEPCEVGPLGHEWELSVCEGRIGLTSGCAWCDDVVLGPVGGEDVEMDTPIVCKLTSHVEHYYGGDIDHWWELSPQRIGEPDK